MSYIIKTAAVTQKSVNGEFNSDNLNLNGRVLSIENANNGFKGAGSMRAPFAVAFASSPYNGFAGAALTALNDRLDKLKEDEYRFDTVLEGFISDSKHALAQCDCNEDGLAFSALIGYENKIVATKMGNACVLRYTDGDLINIGAEQAFCSDVIDSFADGDLFVLCPAAALTAMTEGEIIVALNAADGNEKKAVQLLASKFAKRNADVCDTFVVIRIVRQDEPAVFVPAETPVAVPEYDEAARKAEESAAFKNVYEPEIHKYDKEEQAPQQKSRPNVVLWLIMCIALVIVMVIAGFAAYKISFSRNHTEAGASVVEPGSDAQYDMDVDLVTEVPTTEEVTEEVTEEPTSEEATEEATEEETEEETQDESYDEDDYYGEEDDSYNDDDYTGDDYYGEEDTTTVPPVTRPVSDATRPTYPSEWPTNPTPTNPAPMPTTPQIPDDGPGSDDPIEAPDDNIPGEDDVFNEYT